MTEREIPGIVGIGKAVGRRKISNTDVAERIASMREESRDSSRWLKLISAVERMLRPVGTKDRFWVDGNQATSDLAAEALLEALEMAHYSPRELNAITVGTMSSDYLGVPIAPAVAYKTAARENISAKDIGAACVGFLHSLYEVYTNLTSPFGRGAPQAVIGADVLSKHIHPSHRETFGLFGDAAGAVIVDTLADKQNMFSKIAFDFGADGKHQKDLYVPAGGTVNPTTLDTVNSNQHCLQMNGPLVKEQAIRRMAESVHRVMQITDVKVGDVSLFLFHQANKQIVLELARFLSIPYSQLYMNIDKYGNTSAASIPLSMKDSHDDGRLLPNQIVVLASFGAGFINGAAVIPTVGLPKRTPTQVVRSAISRITG